MPRRTLRYHLLSTLVRMALGLCAATLPLLATAVTAAAATGVPTATATTASAATATPAASPANKSPPGTSQSLPEVTITAKVPDAHTLNRIIKQFVQSHAKPSTLIGQVGRWRDDVCPTVSGLQSAYGDFVSRRITSVARAVGAPARGAGKKCTINVEVVFTPLPQQLLDHIAKKYRPLLGYYRVSERKQVITFSHPIQAWYMTGTRSLDYQPPILGLQSAPNGLTAPATDPAAESPFVTGLQVDSDQSEGSGGLGPSGFSGSRLTRGLRSEFVHILIIADSKAVSKYPLQSISDYIALLALTRLASLDACSELPSIVNLFAPGCAAAAPATITTADTAYLKALYGADLDQNLNIEQGDMHERMLHEISNQ